MKAAETYTAYEAKSRFSEVLRKVRSNRRIVITHHGTPVALISPFDNQQADIEKTLAQGIEAGLITPARGKVSDLGEVAKRPGALQRFLDERD